MCIYKEKEIINESNILITGGAGFIGSNLAKVLTKYKPKKIVVVDNLALMKYTGTQRGIIIINSLPDVKFFEGSAADEEFMYSLLKNEKIDVIFNLAILPLPLALIEPKVVFENNVKIMSVLCEFLRKDLYNRLIHFSSSEVYGSALYVPMDEEHPLKPSTSYGASKASQDLLGLSYYLTYGIDIRILRPFNNIGPGQNDLSYSAVVPRTIRRILNHEPPEIFGDGMQTRDFIYVEDTCEAAIKTMCMENIKGEVINIGSGKETKIVGLIKKICELMNYNGEILYKPPRPGDIRRHYADISKAKALLGFNPKINLEEALKRTIEWYTLKLI